MGKLSRPLFQKDLSAPHQILGNTPSKESDLA